MPYTLPHYGQIGLMMKEKSKEEEFPDKWKQISKNICPWALKSDT